MALAAAGLPDLQVRLMRAKPYADRLFEYRELGRLRDPEARVALVKPAALLGVEFTDDAAAEVVRLAAGYPYFLQEYGRELWNAAETPPITMADVDEVRDLVREQLARTFYGTRFEMASDAEQRYMAAMASLGDPPYSTAEVARAWGAENQRQTSPHRDSLLQKASSGLPGGVRSTSPSRSSPSSSSNITRLAVFMTSDRCRAAGRNSREKRTSAISGVEALDALPPPTDLSFSGAGNLYGTHALHAFAARCPPPLVDWAIRNFSSPGSEVPQAFFDRAGPCLMGAHSVPRRWPVDPVRSRPCGDVASPRLRGGAQRRQPDRRLSPSAPSG